MDVYRHGDVLIAPVEVILENARKLPDLVLARGELTGHAHRVETDGLVELYDLEGERFLRIVDSTARIVHEEHQPIQLPPGTYHVWRQREYSPEHSSFEDEQTIQD